MTTATLKRPLSGLLSTVLLSGSALTLLSLTATHAAAATLYTLPCEVNQFDGVALQSGKIMVRNTTGRTIPENTNIEITIAVRPSAVSRTTFVTSTVAAYRNVYVNESLSSGDTPSGGRSCTARVSFLQRGSAVYRNQPIRGIEPK